MEEPDRPALHQMVFSMGMGQVEFNLLFQGHQDISCNQTVLDKLQVGFLQAALSSGNASQLQGNTWAVPGAIGATTPNTGAFTTLSASGTVTFSGYGAGLLHSDSSGNITSSAVNLANGDVSGILGVADGGTGSSNGSITGTSGLVFAAGGTNQNITLTPSGTGFVILNGNVGIGTSTPFTPLHIAANATDTAQGSSLLVDGILASVTNPQAGITSQPNVIPGAISNLTYDGMYSQPYLDTGNLTNGTVEGINAGVQYNGTGILGTANGGYFQIVNASTGTVTAANGLYINNPINNGTITTNYGLYIANQTAGSTNYALYSNGGTNYFAGNVGIGTSSPIDLLNVVKNSGSDLFVSFQDTVSGKGSYFQTQANSTYSGFAVVGTGKSWNIGMRGTKNFILQDVTNATTPFTIASGALTNSLYIGANGNVGIGSASATPASPLDVRGASHSLTSAAGIEEIYSTTGQGANVGANIAFIGQDGTIPNRAFASLGGYKENGTSGDYSGYLAFATRANGSSLAERMRISSGGNVGIGTNAPDALLSLKTSGQNAVVNIYGVSSGTDYGAIQVSNTGGLTNPSNRPLILQPNAGNVGIGTTAPGYTLDVSGNLNLTGITRFNTVSYTWPSSDAASSGYVLSSNGSGTLSWVTQSGGTNYLQLNSGILSPATISNTLSIGSTLGGNAELTVNQPNSSGNIFSASQSGSTKFVITNNGNVGVGTTPVNMLDVNGGVAIGSYAGVNTVPSPGGLIVSGKVGIGTATSAYNLGVSANSSSSTSAATIGFGDTGSGHYMRFLLDGADGWQSGNGQRSQLYSYYGLELRGNTISSAPSFVSGNGGADPGVSIINTQSSIKALAVLGASGQTGNLQEWQNSNGTALSIVGASGNFGIGTSAIGNGQLVVNQPNSSGDIFSASQSGTTLFNIDNSGNTRITGSLCVKGTFSTACSGSTAGTIYATNTTVQSADVAENYVSSQTLEPGDVIMPAADGDNQAVIKTTSAYQSQAIGIVSTNPGVTLNSDAQTDSTHPNKYPIALQGRVPVKVSSMNGIIHAGDLLTSSSLPGVAMKATHAGQIIGKALADYTDTNTMDIGTIMVFVNISWADPTMQIAITNAGDISLNGQPVSTDTKTVTASSITSTPAVLTPGVSADQFTQLQTQVSSISAQLGKIDDLSRQLADLQKQTTLIQTIQGIGTQAAVLGAATTSGDTTVGGNLSVSGRTLLSDVGITGQITDGLLAINGMDTSTATNAATINTLSGPLKIQSLAINGVDFLNGKVTIDTNGNIVTQGDITAKAINAEKINLKDSGDSPSVGEATIPAGQTSVEVKTSAVTEMSKIFVTLKTLEEATLVVTHQDSGKSFTVELAKPTNKDTKFNWWVIN